MPALAGTRGPHERGFHQPPQLRGREVTEGLPLDGHQGNGLSVDLHLDVGVLRAHRLDINPNVGIPGFPRLIRARARIVNKNLHAPLVTVSRCNVKIVCCPLPAWAPMSTSEILVSSSTMMSRILSFGRPPMVAHGLSCLAMALPENGDPKNSSTTAWARSSNRAQAWFSSVGSTGRAGGKMPAASGCNEGILCYTLIFMGATSPYSHVLQ